MKDKKLVLEVDAVTNEWISLEHLLRSVLSVPGVNTVKVVDRKIVREKGDV